MMRGIKSVLVGIAIILFGSAIACSSSSELPLVYIGWGISLFGLIVSIAGYLSDDK
jgi:hypothetical protein